jgi:hypothetical protein
MILYSMPKALFLSFGMLPVNNLAAKGGKDGKGRVILDRASSKHSLQLAEGLAAGTLDAAFMRPEEKYPRSRL